MKQKSGSFSLMDWILPILTLVLLVGVQTLFHACGPTDEGGWMACHWAQQAVTGVAAFLLVLSLLRLLLKDAMLRTGLDIAILLGAVLSAVLPGILIHLCMMDTMRCRAVMRPAVIVVSALIMIAAAASLVRENARKS